MDTGLWFKKSESSGVLTEERFEILHSVYSKGAKGAEQRTLSLVAFSLAT